MNCASSPSILSTTRNFKTSMPSSTDANFGQVTSAYDPRTCSSARSSTSDFPNLRFARAPGLHRHGARFICGNSAGPDCLDSRQRGNDNPLAFLNGHQLIGRDARKALDQTIGPVDLKIGMSILPQSEMEPAIIHRIEARLPHNSLGLYLAAILGYDSRPDRASV